MTKFDRTSPIKNTMYLYQGISLAGSWETTFIPVGENRGYMFIAAVWNTGTGGAPTGNINVSFTESDEQNGVYTPVPDGDINGVTDIFALGNARIFSNISYTGKKPFSKVTLTSDADINGTLTLTLVEGAPPKAPQLQIVGG